MAGEEAAQPGPERWAAEERAEVSGGSRLADYELLTVTEIAAILQRELACLLWTSPAWRMQARDAWIGWNDNERRRHLQAIVNQGRFLILPGVRAKGLASKILARSARPLPDDWEQHYAVPPLLLETLVDAARFRGTCYRAANGIHVGQTSGRGRRDRQNKAQGQAVKDIYVYPLVGDARQRLRGNRWR